MQRFGQTQLTGILAGGGFGCALVLLLLLVLVPAAASATSFSATAFDPTAFNPIAFNPGTGRCMDISVSDMAEQGVTTFMMPSSGVDSTPAPGADNRLTETDGPAETPCTTNSDADPSSNFCFEDAEGQISTLPRLLAQWRAEQAAGSVIDSMMAAMEQAPVGSATQMAAASIELEPVAPEGESCSNNPDECRSLPPLPPTLAVDVSAPGARQILFDIDIPSRLSEDDTRAWADLRIGPRVGHRDPPDQPPRA